MGSGCDVLATAPAPTPTVAPKPTPQPQRATVQVRRGTIVDAIKVLGRVTSSREADLSFRNSGRIREVYVQPGDMVAEGQALAELDQGALPWQLAKARVEVERQQVRLAAAQAKEVVDDTVLDRLAIRGAELGVAQAQITLEKVQAGPQEAEVKSALADVAAKQAALDKARFGVRDKQAELAAKQAELAAKEQSADPVKVLEARAELEQAKIKLEQARAGPRLEEIRQALVALDQERTKLDRLRDQPKVKAEDLAAARLEVEKAQVALAKVLADIDAGTIKGEANKDAAVRAAQFELQKAQNTYDKLAGTAPQPAELRQQEQAVQVAELALAKLQNQPALDVEAAQAAVAQAQAKLDQLLAGPPESELNALRAQIRSLELAIGTAEQAVAVAEANLRTSQAKLDLVSRGASEFEVGEARNKVALARTAVDAAQGRLRSRQELIAQNRAALGFDLETIRRAIDQARLDVQNYEAQTGDVKIVAPFAGRITRLAGRPGDTVQAFFPVLNVSSLEGLVVKADIAEADLARIAADMPVELTMDAYPNQVLAGRVEALPEQVVGQVGQAPDRSTRIAVDWPGPGAEMGMLARVQITLLVKPDVLMVPNGAVRTVGRRRFVEYMDGDIKRSRNVEVGITTDQDTEIVSGLQEGMVILAGQS
jgi:multidrug efflux pump subunit AcrA (membrane-fusion protein)